MKGSLKKFWNGIHLEEEKEEREDLEIRGCRKLQHEWERRELTTWKNGEGKKKLKH